MYLISFNPLTLINRFLKLKLKLWCLYSSSKLDFNTSYNSNIRLIRSDIDGLLRSCKVNRLYLFLSITFLINVLKNKYYLASDCR